ncbi:MAG: hybrid sensor histidine kinase/response regulator [Planctomycetes bacterium]|nr:hybrid sensor histidine kinase/response regulator [Planctomycetota bacterium]
MSGSEHGAGRSAPGPAAGGGGAGGPAAPPRPPADILVVDDDRTNTLLLADLLSVAGHTARVANSGAQALALAAEQTPDLVLLDIMMPGMDGYQVCRKLRAEAATRLVPVVMVTALRETDDRIAGIDAGADDFISKPFNRHELLARVHSLLRIRRLHGELERALAGQKRLSQMKDQLTHLIIHDLRNPLSGIMGNLDLLSLKKDNLTEKQARFIEEGRRSSKELLKLIAALLDVTKMEEGKLELKREATDLTALAREAVAAFAGVVERDRKTLVVAAPAEPVTALVDRNLILRVIENLLTNALKYTTAGGKIVARVEGPAAPGGAARCGVEDDGEGIPVEVQNRLFTWFGQVEARAERARAGAGLGLSFCKLAAEAHGGRIWVESAAGTGSKFIFELPTNAV